MENFDLCDHVLYGENVRWVTRSKKRPTPRRIKPRGRDGILNLSKNLNALGSSHLLAGRRAAEQTQSAEKGETGPCGGGERDDIDVDFVFQNLSAPAVKQVQSDQV